MACLHRQVAAPPVAEGVQPFSTTPLPCALFAFAVVIDIVHLFE